MEGFKLFGGSQIEDVGKYVLDYVTKYPETMVFIGTDSTQLRKITLYATAIMLYHPGRGAHIVFKRDRVPKIKDLFTRLWKEVEIVKEVAEYIDSTLKGKYKFEWTKDTLREYNNMLRMPTDKELEEANNKLQNDLLNMEKQVQGATIEDKINRIVWDTERALYDLNIMARMDRFDEASYKDRLSIITNTVLESIAKQANLKADTNLKGTQATNTNADTALKELTTQFMPEYLNLAMKSNSYENRDSLSRQKEAMTNEWKASVEKQLRERGLDQKDTEILIDGLDKALDNIWKGAKSMR